MRKVLIIEDEEALGGIYREALEKAGYEARWLPSTRGVEPLAKEFSAHVLLIDHGLTETEKTGIESLSELKIHFPEAFLIILSNYSDFLLKEKALQAGADDYWLKVDNSLQDITQKLETLLR